MNWLLFHKRSPFRKPLFIAGLVLAFIVMMPITAVVVASQTGMVAVSNTLAFFNPVTHQVEIKDADGNVIKQLQASTVWPVHGKVTLEFGDDDSPYQKHHAGIDIANPSGKIGDPVTTFMNGIVSKVDRNPNNKSGYGEYIIIDHGDGITSLYGHLSQINVAEKQPVKPGDVIGLEGSTGHSTGPHVHFEIRVSGMPVNPRIFMVGDPVL